MRSLLVGLVLLPALALGAWTRSSSSFYEDQALTRSAPVAGEGVNLLNVSGYRLYVCATTGNTLSGGGQIDVYVNNAAIGVPSYNPSLTLMLSGAAGKQCTHQDYRTEVATAIQVQPATNGVTVSGGTTVRVWIEPFVRTVGR